jgi:PAS domain S-box-containing protein
MGEKRESTIGPTGSTPQRALRRVPAAVMVFLILVAAAFSAFGVTKNVVVGNEHRLLRERAAEVSALLRNSVESSNSTLSLLAVLAALPDQAGFAQGAGALARGLGGSVVAITQGDAGFTVTASASGSMVAGQAVGGDLSSLAARALQSRVPTVDLVRDGGRSRLAFAAAGPPPAGIVAVLLTDIDPNRPLPRTAGSPFSEMSGALYAAPTTDPARLVLTSEQSLPLSGDVVEVPFPVGADQWTLVVKARTSLVGQFPAVAPWLLLGAGLLAALLISAFVHTLARRQEFADALVQERTHELESTREFLERLLVTGPAVVLRAELSESDRRISYVSPNVERILGLGRGDVLHEGSLVPYLHPDDVDLERATQEQLRDANGSSSEIEFRLRRPDGSHLWVSGLSVREVDEEGKVGAFVYITDISKRRAAEDALRSAQQAAETANRSKSEFLSRMSHELRTPLNAVLGFSQLLKLQSLSDQEAEAVDQILKGGRHLLDLINEVLDISRIEAGRLLLSPEAVLVSDLVEESMDLVRAMAEERDVRLVTDRTGMEAYVFADRQRAKQVVLNLLSNAVKYNHPRGSVAVSCRDHGATELRISVADTGPGIRAEMMGRLFAPFDRLDAGQTDVEGTGIGLALAKSLAEAMGGTLSVESVLGQGSTFSVDLPRVEGPVERYERLQPEQATRIAGPTGHAEPGRRHKVLYIEDNPSNLRLIERILGRREDIEVVSAMQGRFGIELARQHQPSLILLDLHLPDIGGEEVLRRLVDDPLTASIPVVMVTADATVGQVQRLLSAGAAAYLTKPLDVAQLLGLLDEMLVSR